MAGRVRPRRIGRPPLGAVPKVAPGHSAWGAKLVDRFGRSVGQIGQGRGLSPEAVHRAHRQVIRLRVALAVGGSARSSADADLAGVDDELRRVGRWLGRVRNVDVPRIILEQMDSATAVPATGRAWRRTVSDLRRTAERKRRSLEERMSGGRAKRAVRHTARVWPEIQGVAPSAWEAGWWNEWEATHREIRTAMDEVDQKGSMRRLHRLRIALRRARMLHEAGERTGVHPLPAVPPEWVDLSRGIGRLHDLKLALREVPRERGRRPDWSRELTIERTRLLSELLGAIRRSPHRLLAAHAERRAPEGTSGT